VNTVLHLGVLATLLFLSSCVVWVTPPDSPAAAPQGDISIQMTTSRWEGTGSTEKPPEPTTVVVEKSPTVSPPPCPPFHLPTPKPVPSMEDLRNPEIDTQDAVERVLVGHIQDLRQYIREERQQLTSRYQQYRDQCDTS